MATRRVLTVDDLERARDQPELQEATAAPVDNAAPRSAPDRYSDALLKLVPPESVGAFFAIDSLVRGSGKFPTSAYWAAFVALLIGTAYFVKRNTDAPRLPTAWRQILVSTVALGVWILAIGGPFEYGWKSYNPAVAGVIAILFTFGLPLVLTKKS